MDASMLSKRTINAPDAPQAVGGYAQAMEIAGFSRILHVSGQIPVAQDGAVPPGFAEQCRLVWANIEAQLHAAGMTLDNLIKITTYLADRRYGAENREVRRAVLAGRTPASTMVIAGIYNEACLLEIEAIAAA